MANANNQMLIPGSGFDAKKELLASTPESLQDNLRELYFRCRYSERDTLRDLVCSTAQRAKISAEVDRIKTLRSNFARHEQDRVSAERQKISVRLRKLWAEKLEDSKKHELKRIEDENLLLQALSSSFEVDGDNEHLLQRMNRHRSEWTVEAKKECPMAIVKAKKGLAAAKTPMMIRKWRRELKILQVFRDWSPEATTPDTPALDNNYNIMIPRITMKRKTGASSFTVHEVDKFPLQDVLYSTEDTVNPLLSKCHDDEIRYFHFPANNMLWVEEVMGRYYREEARDKAEYNYRNSPKYCKRSSNILCRANWTGIQHGSEVDPFHARHMRPRCAHVLSQEIEDSGASAGPVAGFHPGSAPDTTLTKTKDTRNFILFMPYLHWETDKKRKIMAETMAKVMDERRASDRRQYPHLMKELQDRFTDTVEQFRLTYGGRAPTGLSAKSQRSEPKVPPFRLANPVMKSVSRLLSKHIKNQAIPGSWRPITKLGNYLLDVAKVYESMDIEPDLRLLIDHLDQKPPLHARRTLDQSYHSKLENTWRRDEDQVVYRGTKAGHSIDRTTRVVMVDQLWLYILDDRTVLSFFPRRWGRNKPDLSGVHRSLRSRLEQLHDIPGDEIQSAYDLALMIIDQSSGIFFDRTKLADSRPQVLDIFSNAIAQVSEKKSIAFERFWGHLQKLNPKGKPQMDTEAMEIAARVYLDVNPEGDLLRECHDIIDELRMMQRIYHQQLEVVKHFSKMLNDLYTDSLSRSPSTNNLSNATNSMNGTLHLNASPHRSIPKNTLGRAKELEVEIKSRFTELTDLEDIAQDVTTHLNDLLELKQQQASIIEAKAALRRADESVKQGRAIMMFTIITIIFLPLSFMSSLFGMNAKEFTNSEGNVLSIHQQFRFMFPISFGIIVISLALAFSTWIRGAILFLVSVLWAWCTEYSRLRKLWEWMIQGYNANKLQRQDSKLVSKIYARERRRDMREAVAAAHDRLEERKRLRERGDVGGDIEMQNGLSRQRR